MSSIKNINILKDKIKAFDGEPQQISDKTFKKALANVQVMSLLNDQDVFLFYASLNLLNAYVKQNKNKISYDFKEQATKAFDSVIENRIENVSYSYDKNEGALIVNVNGLQFSYHNVEPSPKMIFAKNFENMLGVQYCKSQQWEELRLQPVAESLFNYANELDGLSNESLVGNLKDFQNECVNDKNDKEII